MERNQPKTRDDEATQSAYGVTDREMNERQTSNPIQSTPSQCCLLSVCLWCISPSLYSVSGGEVKSSITENGMGLGTDYAVMRLYTITE